MEPTPLTAAPAGHPEEAHELGQVRRQAKDEREEVPCLKEPAPLLPLGQLVEDGLRVLVWDELLSDTDLASAATNLRAYYGC